MRTCPSCGRQTEGDVASCPHCGARLQAPSSPDRRKTVTVLFCDVTGSTSLGESTDPEALRALLARYFGRMKTIVEHHGGTVEKFIGDAVMAVFGVPAAHEDDALRAVRAAAEMRDALPDLGVQARIGVNTGEVVTGTEERLVTGDAVNVAARLEQVAAPGVVLIGDPTLVLVRDAVEVEPLEPLSLKGKVEPVRAYRLLRVREAPERSHRAPFVGRGRELALVRDAWDRVLFERRCELVTIVGDAGVGKSRLVAETLAPLDATIARGRCLPYGDGITYWPVVEVLRQLDVMPEDPAAVAAIGSLLGERGGGTSAEEIAWAFRKTLERAATDRPLVAVFDDIQCGEETFLDLLEHVALLSSGSPIMILCMARPELVDRRPTWPIALRLEPLEEHEVERLIPEHLAPELRDRIARAAGGIPLFVEEMVAMAGEANGEVAVPPSLQALLAARLDRLDRGERAVLERGAVEGEVFHRGAVQALAPGEEQVTPRLAALVRRGLIAPHEAELPGEDAFRFRHLLIRDATYDALPKTDRADLHRRFAAWLDERGSELTELDEIAGYHLERAHRYRGELGLAADEDLATSARRRLTAAGRRAYLRGDHDAAINLLERAAALEQPDGTDLLLDVTLSEALFDAGRGNEAIERADAFAARAAAADDRVAELCARIVGGRYRQSMEPEGATDDLAALLRTAMPAIESSGNDLALSIAYHALGEVEVVRGHLDASSEAMDRAVAFARDGAPPILLAWRADGRLHGSTPIPELLAWLDEQEALEPANPLLRKARAQALARIGRFEDARALLAGVRGELADRGGSIWLAGVMCIDGVEVEMVAGDVEAAARLGEEGCRMLDEAGERGFLSTAAGFLGRALYAADRLDEAAAWAERAGDLGASDDASTQMLWRQVKAMVLARRGRFDRAEALAREAVAIGERTDMLDSQGDTFVDLAEVLTLAGRSDEAAEALERAIEGYERKGNVVMTRRTRDRLAALRAAASP